MMKTDGEAGTDHARHAENLGFALGYSRRPQTEKKFLKIAAQLASFFPSADSDVPLLPYNHMSRRLQSSLKVGIQSTYVCRSCRAKLFSADNRRLVVQKRWITRNHIRKIQEAEEDWSLRADAIATGKKQSMLSLLEERGYVNQIIGYLTSTSPMPTTKLTITVVETSLTSSSPRNESVCTVE
jgi:hypothetical protein